MSEKMYEWNGRIYEGRDALDNAILRQQNAELRAALITANAALKLRIGKDGPTRAEIEALDEIQSAIANSKA